MDETKQYLSKLIKNATNIAEIDSFSNYEAGGSFTIYEVARKSSEKPIFVCAFKDERHINNPFNPQIIEEMELGYRWKVRGAFSNDTVITQPSYIDPRMIDDSAYYFYVLDKN